MLSSSGPITIVVAYYPGIAEAMAAFDTVSGLQPPQSVQVLGATVFTLDVPTGKLVVRAPWTRTAGSHGVGDVVTTIFPPEVLAVGSRGRESNRVERHFRELGFATNLLKEIGENLPPSGAALVVAIEDRWLEAVSRALGTSNRERFASQIPDDLHHDGGREAAAELQ